MPLPNEVPTFTLTAHFPPLSPDGEERTGSFTFTPVPPVLACADGVYLGVENATLDASGGLTKELVACDALDEPFVWRVDQNITGTPPRSYNISVPASAGTVSLGSHAEFEALPDDYAVVIGPRGPTGPAGSGGAAGALLAANNLSDLGSAATARTNLGLGTAAVASIGSTAGTVAAGNDARLSDPRTPTSHGASHAAGGTDPVTPGAIGALSAASNLGDVASAAAARTNLGLGTAATQASSSFDPAGSAAAAQAAAVAAIPGASSTVAGETTFGQASAVGSSTAYARGDHTHGTPTLPTATTSAAGVVQLDGTAGDIQPLGSQAAGAVGKAADAGHVHAMPRLDQVTAPTGAVALNGQKVTNLANGTAASDAAAFGQIPTAGTGAGNYAAGNDSRITGAAQKASNLSDLSSASSARANLGMVDMVPADAGLLTWSFPPWAASSTGAGNSGFIYYMRVKIPVATTVTNAELYQTAAGSSLTAGLVGLYTQAGSRVAVTADQASSWASGAQVEKVMPFTSSYSASAGYYWVGMLFTGTTGPSWAKGPPSGSLNAGWHSAPYPALISASGQTTLPASIDLTSLSLAVSAFWAALS